MENDYFFWEKYLKVIVERIKILIDTKDEIQIDFHIHSDFSADSEQSLEEIILKAKEKGFDIISITDHDSIDVFNDLYKYLRKNESENLIIIPGVEFTINNNEYGSQFHILQLMINPKSKAIVNDIKHQQKANWVRIKKQFGRIRKNKVLQFYANKYNINFSIEEYKEYLNKCHRKIPEYKTIMEYLMNKMYKHSITNWDILLKMREWNNTDKCIERKKIKEREYDELEKKYKNCLSSEYNNRFFHRLLAVRGADDDFFPDYNCRGDLSVNNYNELKLDELNKENMTFFAHPSENKMYLLNNLLKLNNKICGMEYNKRCKYSDEKKFNEQLNKLNMIKIIGSDSHNINNELYDDISFYKISKEELIKFVEKAEFYIYKNK